MKAFMLLFLVLLYTAADAGVYFIDVNASPGGDGSSWERAWQNFDVLNSSSLTGTVNVAPG